MAKKPGKCLVKSCQEDCYSRGLCNRHYQAAFRRVSKGLVTWRQLEQEGLARESRQTGPRSDFGKQIEAIGHGEK